MQAMLRPIATGMGNSPEAIDGELVDLVVGDLSFIPLGLVLPALVRCAQPDADLVMMVKPQFEVGKERLGSGGVVRSPQLRAEAVRGVAGKARELGLGVKDVTASPLPGPSGNVEYFLWLQWLAETQLQCAQQLAQAAGMPIGLYGDVAVGAD